MAAESRLDHLVYGAGDLAAGVEAFERRQGVRVPPGGAHPLMGTHNALVQLGNGAFLEIIAIDPAAPAPDRQRWFSLDSADTGRRLAAGVDLLTWVVAVDDLDVGIADARSAGFDPGDAVVQRRGDLEWRLSVRADGALVEGGTFPSLIQWPDGIGPAPRMAEVGLRLQRLVLRHPEPARLQSGLEAIGAHRLVQIEPGVAGPSAVFD